MVAPGLDYQLSPANFLLTGRSGDQFRISRESCRVDVMTIRGKGSRPGWATPWFLTGLGANYCCEPEQKCSGRLGNAAEYGWIWDETLRRSISLASDVRGIGLRVELYPEADNWGTVQSARRVRYQSSLDGDDERTRGEVAIKNMDTGEQRQLSESPLRTR